MTRGDEYSGGRRRSAAWACAIGIAYLGFAAPASAETPPPAPTQAQEQAAPEAPRPAPQETDDAGPPKAHPEDAGPESATIAALQIRQDELERKLAELSARQALDAAPPEPVKKPPAAPPPGLAFSLLGVSVHVFGNLTLRYDYSVNSNLTESLTNGIQANWLLTRIRFGAEFGDTGPVTGGLRISSGETPNPTVPFVILSDAFRPAAFGVDQAWAAVRPFADRDRAQLTIGRMKNPFWRGSVGTVRTQMLWDDDVNPAGIALTGQLYKAKMSGAPFAIENTVAYLQVTSLLDSAFVGLTGTISGVGDQLRFLSKYVDAGISYYQWWNLNAGLSVPTSQPAQGYVSPQAPTSAFLLSPGLQQTNTEVNYGPAGGAATGLLDSTFQILDLTAQVHAPIQKAWLGDPDVYVLVDYAHNFLPSRAYTAQGNLSAPNAATCTSCTPVAAGSGTPGAPQLTNGIAVTLGTRLGDKTYQQGLNPMNVWVTYRYVQSDAALATFADSDLGAGTGYQGFGLGANYRVFKNLMASTQYFDFMGYPLMENHVQREFIDLMGDF